jgi:imidazolonepropionase-like amidohydrolase
MSRAPSVVIPEDAQRLSGTQPRVVRSSGSRLSALRATAGMTGLVSLLLTAPALAETVAITNAKIETVGAAGEIPNGTIVIKDGRIAAVGAHVAPPAGARIIDAAGKTVTPGLFAASTNLTVAEVDGVRETRDDQAGGKLGAAFDVQYGVNPASTIIPLARQGGITRAMVTPIAGRGYGGDEEDQLVTETAGAGDGVGPAEGLFAGQAAAVRVTAEPDPVFKPKAAMVVDLGDAGARIAGSHAGAMVLLKSSLEDVRAYMAHKDAYERGQTRAYGLSREDLEALVPVVEGRTPLLVRVHRASDIRQVIKLAREEHLKLVIEGAEEGWLVAADLAASGTPVLIDTEADLPEQFDSLGSRLDNAARLEKAGVLVAIEGSRDFDNLRQARFNAGTAVANGLPYGAALAAVTLNPAKIWGLSDRIGSLEVGKDADVVIWSGDPFETSTWPTAVFIAGVEQPNSTRGLELRDRYAKPADGMPSAYH